MHTSSIRTTGTAPTLRRRSSSLSSPQSQNPPRRVANIEALVRPHIPQTSGIKRERLERESKWQMEERKEQELKLSEMELGYNPWYKGKKRYQREVDPNGFELFRPEKEKQRKWL